MRSKAFRRSCWVVYGFCTRVAISWQSVHLVNRSSGVLRILGRKKCEFVLAQCVGGRLPMPRLCIPFCIPFIWLSSSRNPGELLPSSCKKKGILFHVPFFPRVTFQEFLFARTMFLQKLVPFLPLPPECNNSPACRPKTSKSCHTQQHNPQQRIPVATLVGRFSYLLPSPPCRILQLVHPPLVVPLRPSCLLVVVLPGGLPRTLSRRLHLLLHPPFVGCCVASHHDACASHCPSGNL
jgi:hypothetical protein